MRIHSKLPNVGTTIFTVMSTLATEYNAVNLGQGFPDYPMSEELISLVNEAMRKGFNQYVPMQGYMPLREALAEKIQGLYKTIINAGNRIDWNEVRQRISPKTKMIMLNSPHNPTGAVLLKEDIKELRSIVKDTNIFICSDEVYEHLIFDNIPHQSILRYPDLLERSFVCFSFGKVYHCTGWKLGYCVSSPELMKEFRKIHQFNCFSCNAPSQVALSKFLSDKDSYLSLSSFMQQKRDYFITLMQNTKFKLLDSRGSYFICAGYDRISDESDKDFSIRITKEYGVATIPVSVFYRSETDHKVVRFCFAKKNETLEAAVEKLVNLV